MIKMHFITGSNDIPSGQKKILTFYELLNKNLNYLSNDRRFKEVM